MTMPRTFRCGVCQKSYAVQGAMDSHQKKCEDMKRAREKQDD